MDARADGPVIGCEQVAATTAVGDLFAQDLALADELAREPRRAAAFGSRVPQYQGVPAVPDDRLRFGVTVSAGHLGDGLEDEQAAAAEFAESRECIFETVDGAHGVEFVDDEP